MFKESIYVLFRVLRIDTNIWCCFIYIIFRYFKNKFCHFHAFLLIFKTTFYLFEFKFFAVLISLKIKIIFYIFFLDFIFKIILVQQKKRFLFRYLILSFFRFYFFGYKIDQIHFPLFIICLNIFFMIWSQI